MKTLPLLLILLLLSGCRSAEDAFKDGQQAEMSGNSALAVRYYLETIRLNPELFQAKQRLAVVGQQEIDRGFSTAQNSINSGNGYQGLTQLDATQSLFKQISFHAPSVRLPVGFNELQQQGQSLARSDLFQQAINSENNGEWDKALAILSDVERYNPSSDERLQLLNNRVRINDKAYNQHMINADNLYKAGNYDASLDSLGFAEKYADNLEEEKRLNNTKSNFRTGIIISEATALKESLKKQKYIEAEARLNELDKLQNHFEKSQLDAVRVLKTKLYNTWATDVFEMGKYRESWHLAGNTLKFDGNNQEALERQRKALQFGTVKFALLPVIANKNAEPFVKQIDNDFNNGPARNMPPFTNLVSDFDMRDAFRAFRINPQHITREQALAIAKRTHASFVIFRELTVFRIGDQLISSRNIPIQKVDNSQANMEVRKSAMILNSRLLITIVDSNTGHRLFSKEEDISSKLEYEQGFLSDQPNKFILTNEQKSLLEPPAQQDIQTLENSSVKLATDFFLKTIFPEMEKLVP
ncbi:MAG: hypothetical protein NE328_16725 [Lentisphaeraceae bacterium]|nr:hypothetical protein [Lentisphaeraceae bacterium]